MKLLLLVVGFVVCTLALPVQENEGGNSDNDPHALPVQENEGGNSDNEPHGLEHQIKKTVYQTGLKVVRRQGRIRREYVYGVPGRRDLGHEINQPVNRPASQVVPRHGRKIRGSVYTPIGGVPMGVYPG